MHMYSIFLYEVVYRTSRKGSLCSIIFIVIALSDSLTCSLFLFSTIDISKFCKNPIQHYARGAERSHNATTFLVHAPYNIFTIFKLQIETFQLWLQLLNCSLGTLGKLVQVIVYWNNIHTLQHFFASIFNSYTIAFSMNDFYFYFFQSLRSSIWPQK